MHHPTRRAAAGLLLAPFIPFAPAAIGEEAGERAGRPSDKSAPEKGAPKLPDEVVTEHRVGSGANALAFRARAGALRLTETPGASPSAEYAYIAYETTGTENARRPVVFAFNGGPGAASAWLGLGALGPWRVRMDAEADRPSFEPRLIDNAETWLPFADIVLIDTAGTGFSVIADTDKARSRYYSVDGDIEALAQFIREWLTINGRLASPKYIAGESYGGIRAPKLAHLLSQRDNVGINGLILISPALSIAMIEGSSPLVAAARLPSYAAVTRGAQNRAAIADAEAYASSEYIADLLKGPRDAAAQTRLAARVSALTGLDQSYVRRAGGVIERSAFIRERERAKGKVLSSYDGTVTGFDPTPADSYSDWDDPMLDALRAPLGAAMTILVRDRLKWPVGQTRYDVLSYQVSRRWDYGSRGRASLESMRALRQVLAADPSMRVAIVHGLNDLVTPYYATQLLIDQLPAFGPSPRVKLTTYASGHMLYSSDEGRRGLRDEARALIAAVGD